MTSDPKSLFGILSLVALSATVLPYFIGIARGKTRPHMFSWLLWTLTMGITGAAQIAGGADPGAWGMVGGAVLNFSVFLLSFKCGEKNITRSDLVMLVLGLAAIPLWMLTHTPLWSVFLITAIDCIGYVPTFRKSWTKPWEENATTFALSTLWISISVFAMDEYTLITMFAPVVYVIFNVGLVIYLLVRRRILK